MKHSQTRTMSSPTTLWDPADYARSSDAQLVWAREMQEGMVLQGHEWLLDVVRKRIIISCAFSSGIHEQSPYGMKTARTPSLPRNAGLTAFARSGTSRTAQIPG
jgi:hypothetical protein